MIITGFFVVGRRSKLYIACSDMAYHYEIAIF